MKKIMLLFVAVTFVGFLSANNLQDDPPVKAEQKKTTQVEKKNSDCKTTAKKSGCDKDYTMKSSECEPKKKSTAQLEGKKEEK